jgi:hypothetical protein
MTQQPKELPLVPEGITKEWLAAKLNLPIKTADMTRAIHGTASKLFFALTYEDDASSTTSDRPSLVCVKGGFNPALTTAIPLLVDFYRREAQFYTHIAPLVKDNMRLPKAWYAADTPNQGIVVMEDLSALGYSFGDVHQPWGFDRVAKAMEQMAIVHAATWGHSIKEHPWLTHDYDATAFAMFEAVGYETLVVDPSRPPAPENMRSLPRVKALVSKHIALRNPKFRSMLHGDCHMANATVSPEGDVSLIDWQMLCFGSCFHDVCYFLTGAMTPEDRRTHEVALLDHYLASLHKFGGPKLSSKDEDVMLEFKKSFLSGIGWMVATTAMQPIEVLSAMIERYIAAIEDHNVVELIEGL